VELSGFAGQYCAGHLRRHAYPKGMAGVKASWTTGAAVLENAIAGLAARPASIFPAMKGRHMDFIAAILGGYLAGQLAPFFGGAGSSVFQARGMEQLAEAMKQLARFTKLAESDKSLNERLPSL